MAMRIVSWLLCAILVVRLRLRKTILVQTVHNRQTHESGSWPERVLVNHLTSLVASRVYMVDDPMMSANDRMIPHGHYEDWYSVHERSEAKPGALAFAGIIRPYKGVLELIRAFRSIPDAVSLSVCGRTIDEDYRAQVIEEASSDPRVHLKLEHVDDAELVSIITRAQLVVLPYRDVYNSGALLLALSLGRPVLVRDSATVRQLAGEVGDRWVRTFTGDLTTDDLLEALQAASPTLTGKPDLSARNWETIGAAHAALYRALSAHARTRTQRTKPSRDRRDK